MHQVAGGEDTKAGDIISQWTEVWRRGHEASRYHLTITWEERYGLMSYPFCPDEKVKSLSGKVFNNPIPH